MSKSNEFNLYQTIKSKLKNVHFTRVESSTQNGIPDVNACKNGSECWLELKCNSAKNLGLSKYQMVWIMNRTKAGGRIFTIDPSRKVLSKSIRVPLSVFQGSRTTNHQLSFSALINLNGSSWISYSFPPPGSSR
jgi:hypothetical protein